MFTKQKLTRQFSFSNETDILEELATEIWDFETGNNWTFEQSLLPTGHADGIALYFVDANFCNSSDDVVCDDLSDDCYD